MGGVIATQVAVHCANQLAGLVYAAAFVPHEVKVYSQLPNSRRERAATRCKRTSSLMANHRSLSCRLPPRGVHFTENVLKRLRRGRLQSSGLSQLLRMSQQCRSAGVLDGIPRYYVSCLRDRAIPIALQRRMIREAVCADVVELDTDHTPHLSKTAELAEALEQFAAHRAQATA